MTTELPVLKAVRTILKSGSYGMDIHGHYIRPDDLMGDFMREPEFVTIGLSEDVQKIFDYSTHSTQQVSYSLMVRFYLAEGIREIGTPEFLEIEECARVIIAEVARLFFGSPNLTNTVAETGSITAGVAYLYLREKEYTGIQIEMPVVQEI